MRYIEDTKNVLKLDWGIDDFQGFCLNFSNYGKLEILAKLR